MDDKGPHTRWRLFDLPIDSKLGATSITVRITWDWRLCPSPITVWSPLAARCDHHRQIVRIISNTTRDNFQKAERPPSAMIS